MIGVRPPERWVKEPAPLRVITGIDILGDGLFPGIAFVAGAKA